MHAQIANLITCSHPKECVQPATDDYVMPDGITVLGFCKYHGDKLAGWELGWWQDAWDRKQAELATAEAQYENLVNEEATVERTEAHDAIDSLLEGDTEGNTDTLNRHEDGFKGLDFDDLDDL